MPTQYAIFDGNLLFWYPRIPSYSFWRRSPLDTLTVADAARKRQAFLFASSATHGPLDGETPIGQPAGADASRKRKAFLFASATASSMETPLASAIAPHTCKSSAVAVPVDGPSLSVSTSNWDCLLYTSDAADE